MSLLFAIFVSIIGVSNIELLYCTLKIILNNLKEHEIKLRRKNSKGLLISGANIRFNEKDFTSFKGNYSINPTTKKPNVQGDRKQFKDTLTQAEDILEDLILSAINQALDNIDKISKEKMGPLTGGLNIPGI